MADQEVTEASGLSQGTRSADRTVVMQLFHRLDRGGAEMRTLDLVRASGGSEFEFVMGVFSNQVGALEKDYESAGCEIVRLSGRMGGVPALYRYLVRRKPDVLHAHSATASGAYLLTAAIAGTRVRIAHFRSDGDGRRSSLKRRVQRTVMRALIFVFATRILAVSPEALRFAGFARRGGRSMVVPNGFLAAPVGAKRPQSWPVPADPLVVAHVGRSNPAKNRVRALRILSAMNQKGGDAALLILGEVSAEEGVELRKRARELGIEQAVFFCGPQRDILPWLEHSAVVLNTSRREGLPGALLESLSVGTPVVASDLAGARWIESLLPGARTVDLAVEDQVWAAHVLAQAGTTSEERRFIAAAFSDGPFALERSLALHCQAWRGR